MKCPREPRAAFASREEGLEDAIRRLRIDPRAAVGNLGIGAIARIEPTQADLGFESFMAMHRI